ncbi:MAG TPA: hypothetical protein VK996_00395 [Ramlibacter sp.]|nr:hypothetical protein [Ramlibacter sp.]
MAYPLLAIGIASGSGRWWGYVCIAICAIAAGMFTWEGVSRKEYETIRQKDPTLNLLTWRVNWLLFFALPPALLALYGILKIVW